VGNPFAARALAKKIREFKPDVVHFHNQFPLISPLAIRAAHRSGSKVVMTLHNYRTICAAGVPTREGRVCTECFRRKEERRRKKEEVWNRSCSLRIKPALRHRCYRGSLLATIPLAISIWLYHKCWARWVDRFIVLSEFQRERMLECGFPAEIIKVKGNFILSQDCVESSHRSGFIYVGRLSDEKGVRTLIDAWRMMSSLLTKQCPVLNIIGDGDRRSVYEDLARDLPIHFLGKMPHEQVMRMLAHSMCLIQPSVCWETFGLTVLEAASVGTPSIVSALGALQSLVKDGLTGLIVCSGNPKELAFAVRSMLNRSDYDAMSKESRKFSFGFREEENWNMLLAIYRDVIGK